MASKTTTVVTIALIGLLLAATALYLYFQLCQVQDQLEAIKANLVIGDMQAARLDFLEVAGHEGAAQKAREDGPKQQCAGQIGVVEVVTTAEPAAEHQEEPGKRCVILEAIPEEPEVAPLEPEVAPLEPEVAPTGRADASTAPLKKILRSRGRSCRGSEKELRERLAATEAGESQATLD